jgi:hypothetical protein
MSKVPAPAISYSLPSETVSAVESIPMSSSQPCRNLMVVWEVSELLLAYSL